MKRRANLCLLAVVATLCGCPDDDTAAPADADPQALPTASARNHLVWKRHHAIEQDLARALELPADELCTELGEFNCIREVHLAALGGNDPIGQGLYEPLAGPLVTTPLAIDRVALAACGTRVQRDEQAPVVFTQLDLLGEAPAADSAAFQDTVTTLYRRLLGRDPEATEVSRFADLLVDDAGASVSATSFAQLACFTIATTTEFLYF